MGSFVRNGEDASLASEWTSVYVTFLLRVRDTGVGISEEGKKNLFLNFSSLAEHKNSN